jgi:hypothetical protein
LTRLTEDCGVCLSSCLDYWEDDLVLQAFNRDLILAPQLYGNPWLLRDDEFPKLARIFNLHRKYDDILVHGLTLPEKYGPFAVSRGSDDTRLITLRNLTWEPVTYKVSLDEDIGLKAKGTVQVTQYHPFENQVGSFAYGSTINCEVLPFRACLLKVTSRSGDEELGVSGCRYEVVREVPGKPILIKLLGYPGERCEIRLTGKYPSPKTARLDGNNAAELLRGKSLKIQFGGEKLTRPYHRKIASMASCPVPDDAAALYEATCFAADSSALEVRSLERSGPTSIPVVQAARDAFFNQPIFVERAIWDKNLFDGNLSTGFAVCRRWEDDQCLIGGVFRLDLGEPIHLDKLVIHSPDEFSLQPSRLEEGAEARVSADLVKWKSVRFITGKKMELDLSKLDAVRYVVVHPAFSRITEVAGFGKDGRPVDRSKWRASNLLPPFTGARKAWNASFTLDQIPKGSYLCVAVNGVHGAEGAYAALKMDGKYVGCPDRSVSYPSNVWEYLVARVDRNYTYYVPLSAEMKGKQIEAYVLGLQKDKLDLKPEVWITAYPIPFETKMLTIE